MMYIVNYQEGSRGSFISFIMGLMLNKNSTTKIRININFGDVYRQFLTDPENIDYPNNYLKLKSDKDFMLVAGVPFGLSGFVSYDVFTESNPDWVAIYIVYEPEEQLLIDVINIYKNFYRDEPAIVNYYWNFYLENKDILDREITDLRDMTPDELRKFLISYSQYDKNVNNFNKRFVSTYWNEFMESVPEKYRNRIHRLNFSDIMNDKDKVLNMLSEITNGAITENILSGYDRYIQLQKLPDNLMETLCMN